MIDGDWRKEAIADGRMRGSASRDRRVSYIRKNTRFGEMSKVIDSVMDEHGGIDWLTDEQLADVINWLTRKWRRTAAINRRNRQSQK